MNGFITGIVRKLTTPPFSYPLIATPTETLLKKSRFRIIRRFIRRYLNVLVKGQRRLERQEIRPEHKKILWIFLNMPQIGDTLMDLCSRVLLDGKEVDLYTQANVCSLLSCDAWFSNCYSDADELKGREYDLIIIDVFNKRSLSIKNKYFKKTPFVSMAGFYDEAEFNRTMFSFCRMHTLLGNELTYSEIESSSCLSLTLPEEGMEKVDGALGRSSGFTVIGVGGVHPFRTYDKWPEFVDRLAEIYADMSVVLVGSDNGCDVARSISEKHSIVDFTGKLTVFETAEVIRRARLMICADGGLLHVANAMGTSVVGLFAGPIQPEMRMTGFKRSASLYASSSVVDISPEEILESVNHCINEY